MRVERTLLENLAETVFNIGYEGEKNHVQVVISCPVMFRDHPDAVASMVVRPPQGDLYPVSLTRDGNDLTWDVSASDVAIPGAGILQLTFTDGEGEEAEIIKTVYGAYSVNASLVADGEAPDPVQSWLDEAGAALATFENEIGDIRKITTATDADEGKALSPKTVVNGKVSEWEYIDLADPEVVTQAIDDWLDDHPEATTTVEDGAITEPKLNDSLKSALAWKSDVDGLLSAIEQSKAPVILDTASGEIVTIPDGADGMKVETLTVAIEPNQDLHGQANPYPAGGSINKCDPSLIEDNKYTNWNGLIATNSNFWGTGYQEVTGGETYYVNPAPSFVNQYNSSKTLISSKGVSSNVFTVDAETKYIYWCYEKSSVSYGANILLKVGSSSADFAPYSNICPISGWTGANVARTGKNLLNPASKDANLRYVAFGAATGSTTPNGSLVLNAGTYIFSCDTTVQSMSVRDADGYVTPAVYNTKTMGFTLTKRKAIKIGMTFADEASVGTKFQVELGTVASDYEAYQGVTKTYTFPSQAGTVYGGTLTVNADGTGSLVVDRAIKDLSTVTWSNLDGRGRRYKEFSDIREQTDMNVAPTKFNAENYKTVVSNEMYTDTSMIGITLNHYSVYCRTGDESTPTGNLVYPLATPVTYTLTVEAVSILLGVNNLWADCGNVTMQYPCDTKLFIERLTAPDDDDMIANANISSGKFFMVGNNLYISTSAIAQGETITPGTNCTAVSLADALNQINQ